jgi:hypothetical protein
MTQPGTKEQHDMTQPGTKGQHDMTKPDTDECKLVKTVKSCALVIRAGKGQVFLHSRHCPLMSDSQ